MEPFLGQIQSFSFNYAPVGWAQCNGQLLSISDHQALFSIIGTTYGGDGQRYFALPDMRGRSAVHLGEGAGLTSFSLGETGGSESITLTENNMPEHSHIIDSSRVTVQLTVDEGDASNNETDGGNNYLGSGGSMPDIYREPESLFESLAGLDIAGNTAPAGSSEPISFRSPYIIVNTCIALQGTFPKRK